MKYALTIISLIAISGCNPVPDKRLMMFFEEVNQKAPATELSFFKNALKDAIFEYPDDPIPTFHKLYFSTLYSGSPDSATAQFFRDTDYYKYLFTYHHYLNGERIDLETARQEVVRSYQNHLQIEQTAYERMLFSEIINMKTSDKLCHKGDLLTIKLPFSREGVMQVASYGVYATDSVTLKGVLLDKKYTLDTTDTSIDTSNIEYRIKITSMKDTFAFYDYVLYQGHTFKLSLKEYGKIIERESK
jgi:hypothetical protein